MAKKSLGSILGSWAFLVGVILAVIAGLITLWQGDLGSPVMTVALVIIGLIVGLLNITSKETTPFMMSGIVLIIASVFGVSIMAVLPVVSAILASLLAIFIPATIIVAIRNVFTLAKD